MLLVIQPNLQGKQTTEFSCNNYKHTNKNYYKFCRNKNDNNCLHFYKMQQQSHFPLLSTKE